MTYQLHENGSVFRVDDNTSIPANPLNIDYQEFLSWQAAGNTPLPAPEPPTPPPSLSAAERLEAAGFDLAELRALLLGGGT